MTKENSTKPAFVSRETGRGDGFLAPRVWESSALPLWAAAAAFGQWNAAARWTERRAHGKTCDTKQLRGEWLLITNTNTLHGDNVSVFIDKPSVRCCLHSIMKNNINISMYDYTGILIIGCTWLTWCICVQPCPWTCSFATLWPEVKLMRVVVSGHQCPMRAIRVWPLSSVWPRLKGLYKRDMSSTEYYWYFEVVNVFNLLNSKKVHHAITILY